MSEHMIDVTINGERMRKSIESRLTLSDFIRCDAGFTGVHVGCEHGVCGACTVIVDGEAVRSCLMLAVQTDGSTITTVEGISAADGGLHRVQEAMRDAHGLQCGFCTPGVVMTLTALVDGETSPTEAEMNAALSGHLCRCTGYVGIKKAVCSLAKELTINSSVGEAL